MCGGMTVVREGVGNKMGVKCSPGRVNEVSGERFGGVLFPAMEILNRVQDDGGKG